MPSLPTQRTLELYRKLGFTCQVVEKWNGPARKRIDLFGCIDIVAMKPGIGVIGVQACAGGSHAARREKALAEPKLREWLASGGRFEVCSWAKRIPEQRNKNGTKKRPTWTPRREELTADTLGTE